MPQSPKAPPDPVTITNSDIMQAEVVRIKKLLGLDVNRLAIGADIEGNVIGFNFSTGTFAPVDFTITGVSTISLVNVSTSIVTGTQTGT